MAESRGGESRSYSSQSDWDDYDRYETSSRHYDEKRLDDIESLRKEILGRIINEELENYERDTRKKVRRLLRGRRKWKRRRQ